MFDVRLHVLARDDGFDLARRRPQRAAPEEKGGCGDPQ